jgi:hypothetical protein
MSISSGTVTTGTPLTSTTGKLPSCMYVTIQCPWSLLRSTPFLQAARRCLGRAGGDPVSAIPGSARGQ